MNRNYSGTPLSLIKREEYKECHERSIIHELFVIIFHVICSLICTHLIVYLLSDTVFQEFPANIIEWTRVEEVKLGEIGPELRHPTH